MKCTIYIGQLVEDCTKVGGSGSFRVQLISVNKLGRNLEGGYAGNRFGGYRGSFQIQSRLSIIQLRLNQRTCGTVDFTSYISSQSNGGITIRANFSGYSHRGHDTLKLSRSCAVQRSLIGNCQTLFLGRTLLNHQTQHIDSGRMIGDIRHSHLANLRHLFRRDNLTGLVIGVPCNVGYTTEGNLCVQGVDIDLVIRGQRIMTVSQIKSSLNQSGSNFTDSLLMELQNFRQSGMIYNDEVIIISFFLTLLYNIQLVAIYIRGTDNTLNGTTGILNLLVRISEDKRIRVVSEDLLTVDDMLG